MLSVQCVWVNLKNLKISFLFMHLEKVTVSDLTQNLKTCYQKGKSWLIRIYIILK